jgi:ATP-binding cassette subfamily B (MDR/TAP) protein 1
LGLVLCIIAATGLPIIFILYGEFTAMMVDRAKDNITSSPTKLLCIFGGGRQL